MGKRWLYMGIITIITVGLFAVGFKYLAETNIAQEALRAKTVTYKDVHPNLFAVCMPDSLINSRKRDIFFAVGEKGTFLSSKDGGSSWTTWPSLLPGENYSDVYFKNENEGWIAGSSGILLHTENGGKAWNPVDLQTTSYLTKIFFVNEYKGFILGSESLLYNTVDGGKTWQKALSEITEETYGDPFIFELFNDMAFADDKVGWIAGESGLILKTEDGGKTWKQQSLGDTKANINTIAVLDRQRALAGGEQGAFFRTVDGGKTWEKKDITIFEQGTEPLKNQIFKIALLPFGEGAPPLSETRAWHVYVVGDNLGVSSYDFGNGWVTIAKDKVLQGYWLYDVFHEGGSLANQIPEDKRKGTIDELRGWSPHAFMVGKNGMIFRTSDKGFLWQNISYN